MKADRKICTSGEVVEWFMALVLKTSVGASPPSVRIRPSPLLSPVADWAFLCLTGFSGQLHCFKSVHIVARMCRYRP